ncbi:MAG: hypothetical protein AABY90_09140, partial [Nitrospirota bacterium]
MRKRISLSRLVAILLGALLIGSGVATGGFRASADRLGFKIQETRAEALDRSPTDQSEAAEQSVRATVQSESPHSASDHEALESDSLENDRELRAEAMLGAQPKATG